jgi:hypothetical protein
MKIVQNFHMHIASIEKLMNFDHEVLDLAITSLRDVRDKLAQHPEHGNLKQSADRKLKLLENIRHNDSLRHRYETIFNQALVLLVSYFSSSMHDLFCQGVREVLARESESALLREQFRLTFRELRDAEFDLSERAPDLLVQSKDISFQNMQSIGRAFKDYLDITLDRNDTVNDIILGLSCRHAIVHTGGLADDRFMRQVASAIPRRVKATFAPAERIQFTDTEVLNIANSMVKYVTSGVAKVTKKFGLEI